MIIATTTSATGYSVILEKLENQTFKVTYGADVTTHSDVDDALDNFKACTLHGLECEGHVVLEDDEGDIVRHAVCKHCDLDIEGVNESDWRDRGNNTSCSNGGCHEPH